MRHTTFLCSPQIWRSKPEMRQNGYEQGIGSSCSCAVVQLCSSTVLRLAWATMVPRFRPYLQESEPRQRLPPVPESTLDGWHPKAHRAVLSLVATNASRSMATFATTRDILLQRHAAVLITSNASCLLSGRYVPMYGITGATVEDVS